MIFHKFKVLKRLDLMAVCFVKEGILAVRPAMVNISAGIGVSDRLL
jgi:F0F1-type ATP synthase epsilon subunit